MSEQSALKDCVAQWLASKEAEMIALLERIVNVDSGTQNKTGVDEVGAIVQAFLTGNGVSTQRIEDSHRGFILRSVLGTLECDPALLLGHRDTVFPVGEAQRRPFAVRDGHAYGPGVADMKAGVVMNAFIMAAFVRCPSFKGRVVALFTGDEEVGSPFSRPVIEAEARAARCVFNSEPGRTNGNVVVRRKGASFMRLEVRGKAAHSGGDFREGASAIEELARKIVGLHALTNFETGTTVNVGLIDGGVSVNTTAPSAQAKIDLRFVDMAACREAMRAIESIVSTCTVAGTSASLAIEGEFLPMVPDQASSQLFHRYQASAAEFGQRVEQESTGACSDSGFAASTGTPTLCAVGPVGGKAHTPDEYIDLASLVPRACSLATALLRSF